MASSKKSQSPYKKELIDVINARNEVVGVCSQEEIYKYERMHRIACVIVFNKMGEMLLQVRSKNKNYLPGFFCTSVGGHVASGETPTQAALREGREELGVDLELRKVGETWFEVKAGFKKLLIVFEASCEGPFSTPPNEVESVFFADMEKCKKMILSGEKIHPELAFIAKKYYL